MTINPNCNIHVTKCEKKKNQHMKLQDLMI
jgi:hypothetical protein